MATKTLNTRMQQLRKTDEQWIDVVIAKKPLLAGEIGFDYTTYGFKVGDGTTLYSALPEYSCVRAGTIVAFASGSAPYGYLLCNGSAVSRTTYSDLFSVCGTKYGAGNGSTTFNIPELLERYIKGFGDSIANITGGANTVTLAVGNIPPHTHVQNSTTWLDISSNEYITPGGGSRWFRTGGSVETLSTGGGTAHNNEPAYTKAYYYIKY